MKARLGEHAVARAQPPLGLGPGVGSLGADHLGQVQPGHVGHGARSGQCLVDVLLRDGFTLGQCQDGAVLRALFAQMAGELARVDVGDRHRGVVGEVGGQRLGHAPVAGQQRQILDDQAGGVHLARFVVFLVGAVVADVRIRERHDLLAVARVGEDFLIAGHRGVEHHFAGGRAGCAYGQAREDRSVGQREQGWREGFFESGKQGVLRKVRVARSRSGMKSILGAIL